MIAAQLDQRVPSCSVPAVHPIARPDRTQDFCSHVVHKERVGLDGVIRPITPNRRAAWVASPTPTDGLGRPCQPGRADVGGNAYAPRIATFRSRLGDTMS